MDPALFIEQSIEGLRAQTSAHSATWHLGNESEWSADLDSGRISFLFADGTTATADVQIVGTFNTEEGAFLWGWDHPSVPEPLGQHARLAKDFGHRHGLPAYQERLVECTEDDAWEFTAVAARLGSANGAYRGPAGTTLVYFTFGEIRIERS
jgi:hypothetical protein